MLISSEGHVKLTDFGLSKIEIRRDLEISDLVNGSPNLNARTPGQLLSLTSHLSFGSAERQQMYASRINTESTEANESKISGVSPFFSAEDMNISITNNCVKGSSNRIAKTVESSASSYETADSTTSSNFYTASSNDIRIQLDSDSSDKENSTRNYNFSGPPIKYIGNLRFYEDSGISSRKSDGSQIHHHEISAEFMHSLGSENMSKSGYMSDSSKLNDLISPVCAGRKAFKRPNVKRK